MCDPALVDSTQTTISHRSFASSQKNQHNSLQGINLSIANSSTLFMRIIPFNSKQNTPTMTYKAEIIKAITSLKDRIRSSSVAIKKHMQADMPLGKKWHNATFLKALKDMVADGDFDQVKVLYKLSANGKWCERWKD
jgi:paraquat-inducible protein B